MRSRRTIHWLVQASLLATCTWTVAGADPRDETALEAGLRPAPTVQNPSDAPKRTPTAAQSVFVIDFESFNLGGALFLDTPESLVFPNAGGSGVTVTITGHDDLRIYDLFQFAGNYGTGRQALIDMDWSSFSNPLGTTISFDPPVNDFSLLAGDYGADDDSPLKITAYDVGGTVLGSDSRPWTGPQFPPFASLSVTAAGIKTIHYSSGGTYASSTFIDQLSFGTGVTSTRQSTWGGLKRLYQ